MSVHGSGRRAENGLVMVVDPRSVRRSQLLRRTGHLEVIETTSLSEAFPIAEELDPAYLALAVDLLLDPELEGLLRMADMLGTRVFLYASEGQPTVKSPLRQRLACVPLRAGDGVMDLIARLSDTRAHVPVEAGESRLPEMILLGASTGGISAIESVLIGFPADCPPTLVVQHIRDGFVAGLVRRLDARCRPRIVEAAEGQPLRRGTIYFAAAADRHLTVGGSRSLPRCTLLESPPRHGHRPAVDPLFESAVPWGPDVAAALLTGMGIDGAEGLGALRRAGAHTIAQDRESSVVWGMPRAAIELGAVKAVLALDKIGPGLLYGAGLPQSEHAGARSR
jgi:two-component system chemotaxis response regulator CheB